MDRRGLNWQARRCVRDEVSVSSERGPIRSIRQVLPEASDRTPERQIPSRTLASAEGVCRRPGRHEATAPPCETSPSRASAF